MVGSPSPTGNVTTWSSLLQTDLGAKNEATLHAEAMKVYAAADVNRDGILSKTEMKKVIQKDPGLRAKLVSGSWKDFFAVLDTDGDTLGTKMFLSGVWQAMVMWI